MVSVAYDCVGKKVVCLFSFLFSHSVSGYQVKGDYENPYNREHRIYQPRCMGDYMNSIDPVFCVRILWISLRPANTQHGSRHLGLDSI